MGGFLLAAKNGVRLQSSPLFLLHSMEAFPVNLQSLRLHPTIGEKDIRLPPAAALACTRSIPSARSHFVADAPKKSIES